MKAGVRVLEADVQLPLNSADPVYNGTAVDEEFLCRLGIRHTCSQKNAQGFQIGDGPCFVVTDQILQPLRKISLRREISHGIDDHVDQRVGLKIVHLGIRIGDPPVFNGSLRLDIGDARAVGVRKGIADSGHPVGLPEKFTHSAVE